MFLFFELRVNWKTDKANMIVGAKKGMEEYEWDPITCVFLIIIIYIVGGSCYFMVYIILHFCTISLYSFHEVPVSFSFLVDENP